MGPQVEQPEKLPCCQPLSEKNNFVKRGLSAFFLVPLALAVAYSGGYLFGGAVIVSLLVCQQEWLNMHRIGHSVPLRCAAQLGLFLILAFFVFIVENMKNIPSDNLNRWFLVLSVLQIIICALVFVWSARLFKKQSEPHFSRPNYAAAWVAFGLPYLILPGVSLVVLRAHPQAGLPLVFYLFMVVWATDIGAYVCGKVIGGPKLCIRISPKKTWAGLIGGMTLAAIVGFVAAYVFAFSDYFWAACAAMVLAVVAQAGDLFESFVKRRCEVKDSGTLIPGHGGMLDRIDGLISASVVLTGAVLACGLFDVRLF